MTNDISIELTASEKGLVEAAKREIAAGSWYSQELSKAVSTLDHTRSLSTADFEFALSVLRATLADAISTRRI